jgi:hypothetical protein
MRLSQLWAEFKTEAQHSYRFYSSEFARNQAGRRMPLRRFWHNTGQFFWAVMTKLSPVRRVLLLAGATA